MARPSTCTLSLLHRSEQALAWNLARTVLAAPAGTFTNVMQNTIHAALMMGNFALASNEEASKTRSRTLRLSLPVTCVEMTWPVRAQWDSSNETLNTIMNGLDAANDDISTRGDNAKDQWIHEYCCKADLEGPEET